MLINEIAEADVLNFATIKEFKSIEKEGLSALKSEERSNELFEKSGRFFQKYEEKLRSSLYDDDISACVIDVPTTCDADPEKVSIREYLVGLSIASLFMSFEKDHFNNTPFTAHVASEQNAKELDKKGINHFSPEKKLGFHSDGNIVETSLFIPQYLALFNLVLSYKKPGCLHWLPYNRWSEYQQMKELIGYEAEYEFKLTPSVYSLDNQLEEVGVHNVRCPIFINTDDSIDPVFLNGSFVPQNDKQAKKIKTMKQSLIDSEGTIKIPQKTGRMIILNNQKGMHARDIFEEPSYSGNDEVTRIFMRSVSTDGLKVTSHVSRK